MNEPEKADGYWGLYFAAPETVAKKGVIVTFIMPGGPADRAGLMENDIVLKIDGAVANIKDFGEAQTNSRPGDTVSFTVLRTGKKIVVPVITSDFSTEMRPDTFSRRYVEMTSLGTYLVMLPPDYETSQKEYPLCVILHGMGSSEVYHGRLADQFGREGVIYIAPRYPYVYPETFYEDQMEGWSAYPPYEFEDDTSYDHAVERLSAGWIFACAEDAKKHYRVAGDKVFIIGHSMGAGFAMMCAALYPEKVGSYFAYAPFVLDYYLSGEMLAGLKKNKVRVFLAHGTRDQVLDIEHSKRAEKAMKEAGVDCTFRIFNTEHMFAREIVVFAREWLDTVVRPD